MINRNDIPQLLLVGMQTSFMKGFEGFATVYDKVCMTVNSTKDKETFPFLGATSGLKEWIDERQHKDLSQYSFEIVNKTYEDTLSVKRTALEDNQYSQYFTQALMMGESVRRSYDVLFASAVEAAGSTTCYDGQYFFDTDHSSGLSGTQSNLLGSTAFSATNLKTAITTMEKYKDDAGVVMGNKATHLMVPSGLRFAAMEVINPNVVAGSTDVTARSLAGTLEIIVNPYLTTAATAANSAWYVLNLGSAVKPFIFQNRIPAEFTQLTSGDDYFERDVVKFGCRARFAFGLGEWRYALKGTNS